MSAETVAPGAGHHHALRFLPDASTLRELLAFGFRHLWLIIASFLIPAGAGLAFAILQTPVYEAQSRLVVLMGREYTFQPGISASSIFSFGRDEIVNAELEILISRPVKRAVLMTLGLRALYPDLTGDLPPDAEPSGEMVDRALRRFEKALRVEPVLQSNVIRLSFRHPSPDLSARALALLVQDYMDRRRDIFRRDQSAFLTEQRDDFVRRLHEVEARIESFAKENGIADLSQQVSVLLRELSDLDGQINQVSGELGMVQARLESARDTITRIPRDVLLYAENVTQMAIDSAKATLLHLELRRQELENRYLSDSPVVADVDREIAKVRAFIAAERPRKQDARRVGRNPVHEDLDKLIADLGPQVDGLTARKAALSDAAAALRRRIERLGELEVEHHRLLRERAVMEETYRTYFVKVEEAKILEQMDQQVSTNVRVVEPALPPERDANPRLLVGVAGLFAGLLSAFAVAYAKASVTDVFLTPETVERQLGLRVLGALPYDEHGVPEPPGLALPKPPELERVS